MHFCFNLEWALQVNSWFTNGECCCNFCRSLSHCISPKLIALRRFEALMNCLLIVGAEIAIVLVFRVSIVRRNWPQRWVLMALFCPPRNGRNSSKNRSFEPFEDSCALIIDNGSDWRSCFVCWSDFCSYPTGRRISLVQLPFWRGEIW